MLYRRTCGRLIPRGVYWFAHSFIHLSLQSFAYLCSLSSMSLSQSSHCSFIHIPQPPLQRLRPPIPASQQVAHISSPALWLSEVSPLTHSKLRLRHGQNCWSFFAALSDSIVDDISEPVRLNKTNRKAKKIKINTDITPVSVLKINMIEVIFSCNELTPPCLLQSQRNRIRPCRDRLFCTRARRALVYQASTRLIAGLSAFPCGGLFNYQA